MKTSTFLNFDGDAWKLFWQFISRWFLCYENFVLFNGQRALQVSIWFLLSRQGAYTWNNFLALLFDTFKEVFQCDIICFWDWKLLWKMIGEKLSVGGW